MRLLVCLFLLVLAFSSGLACGGSASPEQTRAQVGSLDVAVEIAKTADERSLGLGGRDRLAQDAGMLFVYREESLPSFWMRGMRFPLDFVWISADFRVVDLTENVPLPAAGTPDSELTLFRPSAPVQYVLEVSAGLVEAHGIAIGDAVTIEPPVATEDAS